MKITKLRIINYLGIKEFVANELGKINMITGDNDTGKTTILKAIQEVFRSSGVDPTLIHTGADEAEIIIEIDGNILAERRITADDNDVEVSRNDQPISKPATFLAQLLGAYNFNPVDFFLAKPKERRTIFLSAIEFKLSKKEIETVLGDDAKLIEWDELDLEQHGLEVLSQLQKQIYNKRHLQGQDVTRLKKAIEQDRRDIPETFDTDEFKDFDFKTRHAELVEANKQISEHDSQVRQLGNLRTDAKTASDGIIEKQQQIDKLQSELEDWECSLAAINVKGKALATEIDSFESPDVESMNASIEAFNDSQELIAKIKEIARREDNLRTASDIHEHLDELHHRLVTTIPQEVLAKMELPVEGISVTGNEILCEGIPIDKMSTSEQIEFSMDLARAVTGKLKAICVDRLESLSAAKIKKFRKAAEGSGDEFQYFTTQVTDGPLEMKSSDAEEKATSKSDSKKKTTKRKSTIKKKSAGDKQTEVEF